MTAARRRLLSPPPSSSRPRSRGRHHRRRPRRCRWRSRPALDGDVLGDAGLGRTSPPIDSFWQITPDEGQPASERTEVRVGYTNDTLYIGVVCHDREPGRIIVAESRRDSPLDETDSFQVILDTFRDGQNGFVFGTNPAGRRVRRAGDQRGPRGGPRAPGCQAATVSGFNMNWDASWEVRTPHRQTSAGARSSPSPSAPCATRGGGSQVWGLNFQRNIRRRNETAFWAPLPRQYTLYRVSLAGSAPRARRARASAT